MKDRTPLAERMRPHRVDQLLGQEHLLGKGAALRSAIEGNNLPSMILWGPPGVGKTTIANIIANQSKRPFSSLSAISAGVKDLREIISRSRTNSGAILFIDEIHRFNKSQQDALLGAVEKGTITLIGATTENPSFEVNSALLSRCQIYILNPLDEKDLVNLINKALSEDLRLKELSVSIKEHHALLSLSDGDARRLLNLLELVAETFPGAAVDDQMVLEVAQRKIALYDKKGDKHYDIISAFIKSVRGSDPNAAVYWLARMIEGGEDVKFIARRLVILASEDIGNANPTALVLATNCFQAVNLIGYPEAEIILSQCTVYLACSPKSNASYKAIKDAKKLIAQTGDLSVPMSIRNAPTRLMKQQGYGKDYQYAHDYEGNFIAHEFLPPEIKATALYNPGENPREKELRLRLKKWWKGKYNY